MIQVLNIIHNSLKKWLESFKFDLVTQPCFSIISSFCYCMVVISITSQELLHYPVFAFQTLVQSLESRLEDDKRLNLQVELLRKDKSKLISQLTAQESVIDGLRAERRIWGQELAQQGASVNKDTAFGKQTDNVSCILTWFCIHPFVQVHLQHRIVVDWRPGLRFCYPNWNLRKSRVKETAIRSGLKLRLLMTRRRR